MRIRILQLVEGANFLSTACDHFDFVMRLDPETGKMEKIAL
jgi:hypothetical protein